MDDNKQPQLKPFAVSVAEAARITDSGESTIWEKLAKGELDAVKDGVRTKVTMAASSSPLASFSQMRSEEHTSELQSHLNLVCRLLLEKKKTTYKSMRRPQTRSFPHLDTGS